MALRPGSAPPRQGKIQAMIAPRRDAWCSHAKQKRASSGGSLLNAVFRVGGLDPNRV
jgi:hypothetical protein